MRNQICQPCRDLTRQCANTAKNGIDAAFGHLKRSKTWFQVNFFGVGLFRDAVFGFSAFRCPLLTQDSGLRTQDLSATETL